MKKILIIEDDSAIAEIEKDYLTLSGLDAAIITDGKKGLEEAQSGLYDLILLDLMLPGTDGFSICRMLREQLDIPILIVSARRDDIDKIRSLGFGADDYIEKPFSPASGIFISTHKPWGMTFSAVTVPFMRCTAFWTMVMPRPLPSSVRLRALSVR